MASWSVVVVGGGWRQIDGWGSGAGGSGDAVRGERKETMVSVLARFEARWAGAEWAALA